MRKSSVRKIGSMFLLSCVWLGTTAAFPLSAAAQQAKTEKAVAKKQDGKKSKAKKQETPAQQADPNKLGDKENPAMIGKRNINSGSDKFFGWLGGSKDTEARIGRQLAMEVEQQAKMVEDPIITEYVNRIGQNIVLHSDAKVPFTIKVIDSDEVNAFALPGGYFFVNKGLILAADNEAEIAGVMAHEIAHVAARHAMENQGKASAINYGMLAGIIFGGGVVSTVLQNGGGIFGALGMLKFSRGAETEADRLGVQYLYASGYDPTAMATMFEKLASRNRKKPGTVAKLFTSHPQSIDRRDTSLSLVARFPEREEYVISTSEFNRVKARLMKTTNAKSATTVDFDEPGESGKPTLKRRQPDGENPTTTAPSNPSEQPKTEAPPQLKRRGGEPEPKPSPE